MAQAHTVLTDENTFDQTKLKWENFHRNSVDFKTPRHAQEHLASLRKLLNNNCICKQRVCECEEEWAGAVWHAVRCLTYACCALRLQLTSAYAKFKQTFFFSNFLNRFSASWQFYPEMPRYSHIVLAGWLGGNECKVENNFVPWRTRTRTGYVCVCACTCMHNLNWWLLSWHSSPGRRRKTKRKLYAVRLPFNRI